MRVFDLSGFDEEAAVEVGEHPLGPGLGTIDADDAEVLQGHLFPEESHRVLSPFGRVPQLPEQPVSFRAGEERRVEDHLGLGKIQGLKVATPGICCQSWHGLTPTWIVARIYRTRRMNYLLDTNN